MMEGRVLGGRYELLQIVGQGGMGTVYKARCRILDRIVAVKILKEEFADNASFVEKFRTEAMAAARITHSNIVNVYDVGQDNGIYYIVMEYVDGYTLKEYIESQSLGVVPIPTAINIAIMICDGVQYAHEHQVIHRDLKPQNILLTNQGAVKVADFGIARANTTATITFNKDQVIGSVHYISPEQARGAGVGYATDIYSIGCILYEMCTGRVPFDAESPVTVALKHLHDEPIPPADLNPAISPELEDIILHAMMKLPERRFQSVEEMGKELFYVSTGMKNGSLNHEQEKELTLDDVVNVNDKVKIAKRVKEDLGGPDADYPPPKKKRRGRLVIIILIIIAILAFILGIVSAFGREFFGREVQVPGFVGLTYEEAEELAELYDVQLDVISRQPDDMYDENIIISQDPEMGSNVKTGREIKVIISTGLEDVEGGIMLENLIGMTEEAAEMYLKEAGLMIGLVETTYDQVYPEGTVISQSPAAGRSVAAGSEVSLMISKGEEAEKVRVPDCTGSTQSEAEQKLLDAGLQLGTVSYADSSDSNKGKVIDQSILANTMTAMDTVINLTLGNGERVVETEETPEAATEPETDAAAPDEETSSSQSSTAASSSSDEDVLKSSAVTLQLPTDKSSYAVSVEVTDDHGQRNVFQQTLNGGTNVTLNLSYYGSGTYQVYLDGNPNSSGTL